MKNTFLFSRSELNKLSLFDKKNRKHALSDKSTANTTIFGFDSTLAVIAVLIAPTLFTIIAYPNTFSLSWNQGRGGFLFAMAFIAAEIFGLQSRICRKRFYIVIGLSMITIGYFIALPLGLRDSIIAAAPYY